MPYRKMTRLSGMRQVKESNESYIDHNPLSTASEHEAKEWKDGDKHMYKKAEQEFR